MSSISPSFKLLLASGVLAGLALSACAGDEPSSAGTDTENTTGSTTAKKDAGTAKKDASAPKKDAAAPSSSSGQSTIPGIKDDAVEGEPCGSFLGGRCADDACDEPPCGTKCTDGVFDACASVSSLLPMGTGTTTGTTPATGGGTADASTSTGNAKGDAGSSTSAGKDASASSSSTGGDAGAATSGALTSCPAPNECSNPDNPGVIGGMLLGITKQARYCTTGDKTGGSVVCADGVADCVAGGLKNATCMNQWCIQLCK